MSTTNPDHVPGRRALQDARRLVTGYLALSVLALVAIVLLRNDRAAVDDAVWTRGAIVVASALLMTAFAARAARGSARAWLRLRIVSAVMVVAIVMIVALPGTFPVWMKIEQSLCGVVLLAVVARVNGRAARARFQGQ